MPTYRIGNHALPPRYWEQIVRDPATGCWLWTGPLTRDGYPQPLTIRTTRVSAHRHAYLALVGPIGHEPDGRSLTLDHLCRVRACCNPAHLEPCTGAENVRRSKVLITACPAGHPYVVENLVPRPDGRRECRECMNARSRAYWHDVRKNADKAERRAAGYRGGFDEQAECRHGHPRTPDNTYTSPSGVKACVPCRTAAKARHAARVAAPQ